MLCSLRHGLCFLLVLLLSGVLSGCSMLRKLFTPELYVQRRTVPFDEMVYERPDFDAFCQEIQDTVDQIEGNQGSYKKQLSSIQALNTGYWDYYTMYALAQLKYSLDTEDDFFYNEYLFFGETEPELLQEMDALYVACSQSTYKDKFEEDYFGEDYLDQYEDGGSYSDQLVSLLQQESELVLAYNTQTANPSIEYNSETALLAELLASAETEEEYYKILDAFTTQSNEVLSSLYTDLVLVRLQIAEELGYDSYADYAYESLGRDYTAQMADEFISQIETSLVPLYRTLVDTGIAEYPPMPSTSWEDVPQLVGSALSQIDSTIEEVYNFMEENNLYDIAPTATKVVGDFTTYIENYDAPFIVISATESGQDLLTFAHEFGHFTDAYLNYNTNYSLDQSESASQAMEYLLLNYLPDFQNSLKDSLLDYKMYDTLSVYVTQGAYTAFEQQVYALSQDEVSADRINEIAQDCAERFELDDEWMDFGLSWVLVPHFFEQAFYCVSYCVSNDVALQIYQAECEEAGKGAEIYLDLIVWDSDMTFLENVARVELKNPCDKARVQEVAQFLADYYQLSLPMAA